MIVDGDHAALAIGREPAEGVVTADVDQAVGAGGE